MLWNNAGACFLVEKHCQTVTCYTDLAVKCIRAEHTAPLIVMHDVTNLNTLQGADRGKGRPEGMGTVEGRLQGAGVAIW